jgi:hypothetical protein
MSAMTTLYVCPTRVGSFYIVEMGGQFHPVYEDEPLGSYMSPEQAADDLAGGHTRPVRGGYDTSKLGIPRDVAQWYRMQRA